MSWRNRKMFDDSPQGIVSGLAPIPRYKEGGFVNPIDYRAGGTVDYPVGMEAGSLVPEVFESGDQQINEALNSMASVMAPSTANITTANVPSSKEIKDPSGISEEPKPIGMVEVINSTVESITQQYKEAARSLAQQAKQSMQSEENFTDTNLENLEKNLQQKLDLLDEEYKSKVQEALYEVDMPLDPEALRKVTLFDETFKTEIEQTIAGDMSQPTVALTETNIPKLKHGGIHPTPEEIYNQRMQEKQDKRELARSSALLSGKSLEGGMSGFLDILGQSKEAEKEAITPENRIDMSTARASEYKENRALNILNDDSLTDEQKAVMLDAIGVNIGAGELSPTASMQNIKQVEAIQNRARTQIAAIEANSSLSDSEKQKQKDLIKQREKYELDVLGVDLGGTDEELNAAAYKQAIAMAKIVIDIPDSEYYGDDPIKVASLLYGGLRPGQPNPFANQLPKPGD
jgi:hypothetical protein